MHSGGAYGLRESNAGSGGAEGRKELDSSGQNGSRRQMQLTGAGGSLELIRLRRKATSLLPGLRPPSTLTNGDLIRYRRSWTSNACLVDIPPATKTTNFASK